MKISLQKLSRFYLLLAFALVYAICSQLHASQLDDAFKSPPDSAKAKTWWHWMNGCISKEGITADLEAFKKAGLGGAYIFHVGQLPIDAPVKFQSDQWWDLMRFAASEANRLGLELGFHNCPGWSSSGGPWITPDKSMQKVVFSEVAFAGPDEFNDILPQPKVNAKWKFYRDIAVLVMPGDSNSFPVSSIIDLSDKMDANGRLLWNAPAGQWNIMRFGSTTTGKTCNPAPPGAEGLECDKLDRQGLDAHFDGFVTKVLENAGPALGKSFNTVLIDSYEVGDQNWSPSFRDEFKKRRGYDPVPWLITMSNRIIDNKQVTARFQYDWKLTIAELFADNYYAYMGERVHRYPGLKFSLEPYYGPFDTVRVGTLGDEVAAEFWQEPAPWGWDTLKPVASSAHIAGIKIVGAEAFTGQPQNAKWQQDPYSLKATGDRAFTYGINQLILHTSAHQPWMNAYPGMTMGYWGTQFGRTQTWWNEAPAWLTYLARCQYMLQEGKFVADLCFLDEGAGPFEMRLPEGFNGDICSEDIFIKKMTVNNGILSLPSGMNYRILVLPNRTTMSPAVARKIRDLANAGATILGPKPTSSPGLQDFPACDTEIKQIASEIWDSGKVTNKKTTDCIAALKIKPDFKANEKKILWIHRRVNDADVYFVSNQDANERIVDCSFRIEGKQPELWDASTGQIRDAKKFSSEDGMTTLPIKFDPRGSLFVVFRNQGQPKNDGNNWDDYKQIAQITGPWTVHFDPCWGGPKEATFDSLADWSKSSEKGIQYYSGTAVYEKEFDYQGKEKEVYIDLGQVKNLAQVRLNGKSLGIAWKPPFRVEITNALNQGKNKLEILVTNLWPNRLIGDEQEPDDCKWDSEQFWDQTVARTSVGRALKVIPDWLTKGEPRPSSGRYTITSFKFYKKDSPFLESGLLGPVTLMVKTN